MIIIKRSYIIDILDEYVDIVFCNEMEASFIHEGTTEESLEFLGSICKIAVIMFE